MMDILPFYVVWQLNWRKNKPETGDNFTISTGGGR
jgi:hypothetical protein